MFKVRSISIRSCPDLLLGFDFLGVNPSKMPLSIHQCGNIAIYFIIFDPAFANNQHLEINLKNIESFSISGIHVDEPIKVIFEFLYHLNYWYQHFLDFYRQCSNILHGILHFCHLTGNEHLSVKVRDVLGYQQHLP